MNIVIVCILMATCLASGYCLGRVHEISIELKETEEKWRLIEKN